MPAPRPSAALLAVAFAGTLGALAGCGGKDAKKAPAAETQVREVVRRYGVAVSRKDYQQICDRLIAQELVDNVEEIGLPCELAFKRGLDAVRGARLRIDEVDVRGPAVAYVRVHTTAAGQPASDDTLKLVRIGTGWRISSLSAAPPPKAPAKTSSGTTSVPGKK